MTDEGALTASVGTLFQQDDTALIEELGRRAQAMAQLPTVAGDYDATAAQGLQPLSPIDDLRELGGRILTRLGRELHSLVCGETFRDQEDRRKLIEAIGIGEAALAASLAALLIVQLGVAPVIAPVVAVLIVRRIFKPTLDEICKSWTI